MASAVNPANTLARLLVTSETAGGELRDALAQVLADVSGRQKKLTAAARKKVAPVVPDATPAWLLTTEAVARLVRTLLLGVCVASSDGQGAAGAGDDTTTTCLSILQQLYCDPVDEGGPVVEAALASPSVESALTAALACLPRFTARQASSAHAILAARTNAQPALHHTARRKPLRGILHVLAATWAASTGDARWRVLGSISPSFGGNSPALEVDDVPAILALVATQCEDLSSSCSLQSLLSFLTQYVHPRAAGGGGFGGARPRLTTRDQRSMTRPSDLFVGLLSQDQRVWLATVLVHALQEMTVARVNAALTPAAPAGWRPGAGPAQLVPSRSVTAGQRQSLPAWVSVALVMLNDMVAMQNIGDWPEGGVSIAALVATAGIEGVLAEAAVTELTVATDAFMEPLPDPLHSVNVQPSVQWTALGNGTASGLASAPPVGYHMQLVHSVGTSLTALWTSTPDPAATRRGGGGASPVMPVVDAWRLTGTGAAPQPAPPPVSETPSVKGKGKGKAALAHPSTSASPPDARPSNAAAVTRMEYHPEFPHLQAMARAALHATGAEAAAPVPAAPGPSKPANRRRGAAAAAAVAPSTASESAPPPADTGVASKRKHRKVSEAPSSTSPDSPLRFSLRGGGALGALSFALSSPGAVVLLPCDVWLSELKPHVILPNAPKVHPVYSTPMEGFLCMANAVQRAVHVCCQAIALGCVSAKSAPLKPAPVTAPPHGGGGSSSAKEVAEATRLYSDATWQMNSSILPMLRLPESIGPSDWMLRRAKAHMLMLQLCTALAETLLGNSLLSLSDGDLEPVLAAGRRCFTSPARLAQHVSTIARVAQTYVMYAPTHVGLPRTALEDAKKAAAGRGAASLGEAFTHSHFSASFSGPSSAPSKQRPPCADAAGFLPASLDSASTQGMCAYAKDSLLCSAVEQMGDARDGGRYDPVTGEASHGSFYGHTGAGEAVMPSTSGPSWNTHCVLSGLSTVLSPVPGLVEACMEYGMADPGAVYAWVTAMARAASPMNASAVLQQFHAGMFCAPRGTADDDGTATYPWLALPPESVWLDSARFGSRIVVQASTPAGAEPPGYPRPHASSSAPTAVPAAVLHGPTAAQQRWPTAFHSLFLRRRAVQACLDIAVKVLTSAASLNAALERVLRSSKKPAAEELWQEDTRHQLQRWGVLPVLRALAGWQHGSAQPAPGVEPALDVLDMEVQVVEPRGAKASASSHASDDSGIIVIDGDEEIAGGAGQTGAVSSAVPVGGRKRQARGADPDGAIAVSSQSSSAGGAAPHASSTPVMRASDVDAMSDSEDDAVVLLPHFAKRAGQTFRGEGGEEDKDDDEDEEEDDDQDGNDEDGSDGSNSEAYRHSDGESDVDAALDELAPQVSDELAISYGGIVRAWAQKSSVDPGVPDDYDALGEDDADQLHSDVYDAIGSVHGSLTGHVRHGSAERSRVLRLCVKQVVNAFLGGSSPPSHSLQAPHQAVSSSVASAHAGSMGLGPPSAPVVHPYACDDLAVDVCAAARDALDALTRVGVKVAPCLGPLEPSRAAERSMDVEGAAVTALRGGCECCTLFTTTHLPGYFAGLSSSLLARDAAGVDRSMVGILRALLSLQPAHTLAPHEFYSSRVLALDGALRSVPEALGQLVASSDDMLTGAPSFESPFAEAASRVLRTSGMPGAPAGAYRGSPGAIAFCLPFLRLAALAHMGINRHASGLPLYLSQRSPVTLPAVPAHNAARLTAPSYSDPYSRARALQATVTGRAGGGDAPLLGPHANAREAYVACDATALSNPLLFTSHTDASNALACGPGGYTELSSGMSVVLHVAGLPAARPAPARKASGTQKVSSSRSGSHGSDLAAGGRAALLGHKRKRVVSDSEDERGGDEGEGSKVGPPHLPPAPRQKRAATDALKAALSAASATAAAAVPAAEEPPTEASPTEGSDVRMDDPTTPPHVQSQMFAALTSTPSISFEAIEEVVLRRLPLDAVSSLLAANVGFCAWGTAVVGRRVVLHPRHIHGLPPTAREAARGETAQAVSEPSSYLGVTGLPRMPTSDSLVNAYQQALQNVEVVQQSAAQMAQMDDKMRARHAEDTLQLRLAVKDEYTRLINDLTAAGAEGDDGDESEVDPLTAGEAMAHGISVASYIARYGRGRTAGGGVRSLFTDLDPAPGVRPAERATAGVAVALHATVEAFERDTGVHVLCYDLTGRVERVVLPLSRYSMLPPGMPQVQGVAASSGSGVPAHATRTDENAAVTSGGDGIEDDALMHEMDEAMLEEVMMPGGAESGGGGGGGEEAAGEPAHTSTVAAVTTAQSPPTGTDADAGASASPAPAPVPAPPVSADPPPPPPADWSCGACTFVNPWATTVCSMCGTGEPGDVRSVKAAAKAAAPGAVPQPVASAGGPHATDFEWSCTRCTFSQAVTRVVKPGDKHAQPQSEGEALLRIQKDASEQYVGITRRCAMCSQSVPFETIQAAMLKTTGSVELANTTLEKLGYVPGGAAASVVMQGRMGTSAFGGGAPGRSGVGGRPASTTVVSEENRLRGVEFLRAALRAAAAKKEATHHGESAARAGGPLTAAQIAAASTRVRPTWLLGPGGHAQDVTRTWTPAYSLPTNEVLKRILHNENTAWARRLDALSFPSAPGQHTRLYDNLHSEGCTAALTTSRSHTESPVKVFAGGMSLGLGNRVEAVSSHGEWQEAHILGLGCDSLELAGGTPTPTTAPTHVLLCFTTFSGTVWYPVRPATGVTTAIRSLPALASVGTHTRDWRQHVITAGRDEDGDFLVEVRSGGQWVAGEVVSVTEGRDYLPWEHVVIPGAVSDPGDLRRRQRDAAPEYPVDAAMRFLDAKVKVKFRVTPKPGTQPKPGYESHSATDATYTYTTSFSLYGTKLAPLGCHISRSKLTDPRCADQLAAFGVGMRMRAGDIKSSVLYDTAAIITETRTDAERKREDAHVARLSQRGGEGGGGASASTAGQQALVHLSLGPLQSHVSSESGQPGVSATAPTVSMLRTAAHDDAALASFVWNADSTRTREFALPQLIERATGVPGAAVSTAAAASSSTASSSAVPVLDVLGASREPVPRLRLRLRLYGRRSDVVAASNARPGTQDGAHLSAGAVEEELLSASLDAEWTAAPSRATLLGVMVDLASRLATRAGVHLTQDMALVCARQFLRSPVIGSGFAMMRDSDYSGASLSGTLPKALLSAKGLHLQVQPVVALTVPGVGPSTLPGEPTDRSVCLPAAEQERRMRAGLDAVLPRSAQACVALLLNVRKGLERSLTQLPSSLHAVFKDTIAPLVPSDALASTADAVADRLIQNRGLSLCMAVQAADLPSMAAGLVPSWMVALCSMTTAEGRDSGKVLSVGTSSAGRTGAALVPEGLRAVLLALSSQGVVRALAGGQRVTEVHTAVRNLMKVGQRYATYDGTGRPVSHEHRLEAGVVVDSLMVETARVGMLRRALHPNDSASMVSSRTGAAAGVGVLARDRISVSRLRILEDAHAVLKLHALGESGRAKLDIMFRDEKAFGEGVSQEFYGCVAAELQRVGPPPAGLFGPVLASGAPVAGGGGGDEEMAGGGGEQRPSSSHVVPLPTGHVGGSVLFYNTAASEATHVMHASGLFPRPLPRGMSREGRDTAVQRWELIGLAVGKAMQDGYLFTLPLSTLFLEAAQDAMRSGLGSLPSVQEMQETPHAALGAVLHSPYVSAVVRAYYPSLLSLLSLARARYALRTRRGDDDAAALATLRLESGASVEDLSLSWVDPASGFLLVKDVMEGAAGRRDVTPGGVHPSMSPYCAAVLRMAGAALPDDTFRALLVDSTGGDVDTSSVDVYVALLALYLSRLGIHHAVRAFTSGLGCTVTPVDRVLLMTPTELRDACCGAATVDWNMDSLRKHVQAGGGYSMDSRPVQLLFEVMVDMSQGERAEFLRFTTGCPALPPGGLPALAPPMKVMQKLDVPPMPAWMRDAQADALRAAAVVSPAPGGGGGGGSAMDEEVQLAVPTPPYMGRGSRARKVTPAAAAAAAAASEVIDVDSLPDDSGGRRGTSARGAGRSSGKGAAAPSGGGAGGGGGGGGGGGAPSSGAASGLPAPALVATASPHDRALVSASTCFHQVRLPPYSTRHVLRVQLLEAIGASAGLIDFS